MYNYLENFARTKRFDDAEVRSLVFLLFLRFMFPWDIVQPTLSLYLLHNILSYKSPGFCQDITLFMQKGTALSSGIISLQNVCRILCKHSSGICSTLVEFLCHFDTMVAEYWICHVPR